MGDALEIEEDGAGVGIGREIVEHVAEIDIDHIPQRHQCEKPIRRGTAQSSIAVIIAPD